MDIENWILTSETNSTSVDYLNRFTDNIIKYGIHGISAIGITFNAVTLFVLSNQNFKHKYYDFLRCRCICNLVVCVTGAMYKDLTMRDTESDYYELFYEWLVVNLPKRIAFFASAISDILLILNRYVTLCDKKKSVFYRLSKSVRNPFCKREGSEKKFVTLTPLVVVVKREINSKFQM